jgi:predicted RNA-binding Zn-ribbon protein involved in translation (DUF1610 family)
MGISMATEVKYTKEVLLRAVEGSRTVREVLDKIGSPTRSGGMATYIRSRIRYFGIDTKHFIGSGWSKGVKKPIPSFSLPPEKVLVKHQDGTRLPAHRLRRALTSIGVPYVCSKCGSEPIWMGFPIVLEVDHIDGDGSNDVPVNLRFLCPNCHSQTDTFRSRNRRKVVKSAKVRVTKIEWPTNEDLQALVEMNPLSTLASRFGVSDKAIKKRCSKLGIQTRGRGAWGHNAHTIP